MLKKFRFLKIAIIGLALMVMVGSVSAANFPAHGIKILFPYGIGGYTPVPYKVVADNMSKDLGQPVLLTPAKGAGGTLAGEKVAKRIKPDGYTLLQANSATNATAFYTKKGLNYSNDDFIFLAQVIASNLILVAGADAPFSTVEEYIAYAKKNPNKIKQASTGIGTSGHMCLELLKIKAGGLKIDLVPFKTQFNVETAVMGGHCQAAFLYGGAGGPNDAVKKMKDSGLKILASATEKRLEAWPDIPTFKEKGYDVVYSAWYGLACSKKVPKDHVEVLKKAIYQAVTDPEVKAKCQSAGLTYTFLKSEEFTVFIKDYLNRVKLIVEAANIQAK